MMNIYQQNHPKYFWCFLEEIPDTTWQKAINQAKHILEIDDEINNIDDILQLVLGETQFGTNHWQLSPMKRLYYDLKPLLPRPLIQILRQLYQPVTNNTFSLGWPVEKRYKLFLWEIGKQILMLTDKVVLELAPFWPNKSRYAVVLTHDIETKRGLDYVLQIADLEESLGFRSSFNFVPERYPINQSLIDELKERGFEVGIHGLKHDGKLFSSRAEFERRAKRINKYLKDLKAVGFRSPLTHRHPEWMQALEIEYDLSFFDTDPFESIPGGTMSVWPFYIGHFLELPYTLVQDYTLISVLRETTPKIWLEKIDFIEKCFGMALVNSHPDYLAQKASWTIYHEFLLEIKERKGYWHALPKEVAKWWRSRKIWGGDSSKQVISVMDGNLIIDFTP